MTNKQERYYVVSESELKRISSTARDRADFGPYGNDAAIQRHVEAEAACRARPVESIGGGMWQDEDYTGEHK